MAALHELTATALVEGYRDRAFSAAEVADAVLARIDAVEPAVHALWPVDPDAIRAAARAADANRAAGRARPLEGVPVTVKENVAIAGAPMPLGAASETGTAAAADAPPVARLREAGAILLGRTVMPDYGMISSGRSSRHPTCRNPWDLGRNPGGSSSGAAAACAAGFGPLHVGTDIGGSIRLPAGWCGIVGFKPSHGRVPIDPPARGRVAGPMTRTVADAALLMSVLARPDARDAMCLPPATLDWSAPPRALAGLRLGLLGWTGIGDRPTAEVAHAVARAAGLLEAAGAIVTPVAPFLERASIEGIDRFWRARFLALTGDLPAEQRARMLPYIRAWIDGAAGLTGVAVAAGFAQTDAMAAATLRATEPFDAVLSPVAPDVAFGAELHAPNDDPQNPFEHIGFTLPFNMSNQPAIAIDCGTSSGGLPIGLQIAGRRFDDTGVLSVARAYERLRGPVRAFPAPCRTSPSPTGASAHPA